MKILYSVPAYTADWLIGNVVANPKRSGTECWLRFEAFYGSVTVADFAKACGKGYRSEIKWCVERGFVTLIDPSAVDEADADADVYAGVDPDADADADDVAAYEADAVNAE